MEPATGFEPATRGLQNRCATVAPRWRAKKIKRAVHCTTSSAFREAPNAWQRTRPATPRQTHRRRAPAAQRRHGTPLTRDPRKSTSRSRREAATVRTTALDVRPDAPPTARREVGSGLFARERATRGSTAYTTLHRQTEIDADRHASGSGPSPCALARRKAAPSDKEPAQTSTGYHATGLSDLRPSWPSIGKDPRRTIRMLARPGKTPRPHRSRPPHPTMR